jgi:hypothetical protein
MTWKKAIFSQYPRPRLHWNQTAALVDAGDSYKLFNDDDDDDDEDSDDDELDSLLGKTHMRVMGYTMKTHAHRYTEWIAYDLPTFTANWEKVYARELYVYSTDPLEDLNVAGVPLFQPLVAALSAQLRAGWRQALPPKT